MTVSAPPLALCVRCGTPLDSSALVCPRCGVFVHAPRLEKLSAEALPLETINPLAAATIWRECLDLLPADSHQFQAVRDRIGLLMAGMIPPMHANEGRAQAAPMNSLSSALLKTFGSMVISIAVYAYFFHDAIAAAGFVVLMLVHEMGHVIANRYYGLRAGPPIFVPFMGAVINLKERPANAKVEAVIGIAGPVAGTIGALICYAFYLHTGSEMALLLSYFGFLLNLFNLLPVPPLDGGRVTAAVSPWIWMLGLAGLVWMFISDFRQGRTDYLLILVLVYALPRIKATLQGRERFSEYYNIGRRASWSIGTLYVALGGLLLYLFQSTGALVRF